MTYELAFLTPGTGSWKNDFRNCRLNRGATNFVLAAGSKKEDCHRSKKSPTKRTVTFSAVACANTNFWFLMCKLCRRRLRYAEHERRMSAFGPKQTWVSALHMSASGGKADMTVCGCLLSRSLLGVKRTCFVALHESASDPKRTLSVHCGNGF